MVKIEVLNKTHDRDNFDCGVQELNQYLKKIARQHTVKGISKSFVLLESAQPTQILGFFTLTFCEVQASDLPAKHAKKYPSKIPAAKLGRLAVSKNVQRQGLGQVMMIDAIQKTLRVAQNIGIIGFFVDAKDSKAEMYYKQFGFISMPNNSLQLFFPISTLQQNFSLDEVT